MISRTKAQAQQFMASVVTVAECNAKAAVHNQLKDRKPTECGSRNHGDIQMEIDDSSASRLL